MIDPEKSRLLEKIEAEIKKDEKSNLEEEIQREIEELPNLSGKNSSSIIPALILAVILIFTLCQS